MDNCAPELEDSVCRNTVNTQHRIIQNLLNLKNGKFITLITMYHFHDQQDS